MRGRRFVTIASILAVLGAAGACSERQAGPGATAKLGSKKPIRVTASDKSSPDPDLSLLTAGQPPKDEKVGRDTLVRLGDAAMQRGRFGIAAGFYARALRAAPKDVALRKKLGFALFHDRKLEQAKTVFESTVKLAPKDAEALRGLGNAKVALSQPASAIGDYRRALKASSGRFADYRIYNGLGVALDLTGEHRAAQRIYRLGLAQKPGNGSLRNNYALSLAAAGNYAEAIRMLERLVREDGASAKYRRNLKRVRAMAAKAGVNASNRAAAPARKTAAPRRTAARAVGPPRRLFPKTLPDIKELAARRGDDRTGRTKDDPADTAAAEPKPETRTARAPEPPAGVTDPADRELLARLHPGARPPATRPPATRPPATRPPAAKPPAARRPAARTPAPRPAKPKVLQADAAALNRLAPGAGHDDAPATLDEAEKADRLFLRALRGEAPKRSR